jgi:hypothetical protein
MDPREELEQHQQAGRARERRKALCRFTATVSAILTFALVIAPLFYFFGELLGRRGVLLFIATAAAPAGAVYRFAGGAEVAAIEAWERKRDDL